MTDESTPIGDERIEKAAAGQDGEREPARPSDDRRAADPSDPPTRPLGVDAQGDGTTLIRHGTDTASPPADTAAGSCDATGSAKVSKPTARRIAANRANAKRSTGPRTASGKARAAQNARQHGLCARATVLGPDDDPEAFEALQESLRAAWQPVGAMEEFWIGQMARALWRSERMERVELGLLEDHGSPVRFGEAQRQIARVVNNESERDARVRTTLEHLPELPRWRRVKDPEALTDAVIAAAALRERAQRGPAALSRAFVANLNAFGLLARYGMPLRRDFYAAVHELERLQRRRAGDTIAAPEAVDVHLEAHVTLPGERREPLPVIDPGPSGGDGPGDGGGAAEGKAEEGHASSGPTPGRGTEPDAYRDPRFRPAMRRKVGAILRATYQPAAGRGTRAVYETNPRDANGMAPARENAVPPGEPPSIEPVEFAILAEALEPLIGAWPVDAASLGQALARAGVDAQVEAEGIDVCASGRQSAVQPQVRRSAAVPEGAVEVVDVPQYIQPALIHALPDPEVGRYLGGVVGRRRVRLTDRPAPGHCWYVVQDVPRLGRRLRLWDQTDWPEREEMTDANWAAFIAWWNAGVAAGWGLFSMLNDTDGPEMFLEGAPDAVLARLTPTPALVAWMNDPVNDRVDELSPGDVRSTPTEGGSTATTDGRPFATGPRAGGHTAEGFVEGLYAALGQQRLGVRVANGGAQGVEVLPKRPAPAATEADTAETIAASSAPGITERPLSPAEQAIADCTVEIERPDAPADQRAKARLKRARVYRQQGRPDQANADYTAVIAMAEAPALPRALARFNRAVLYDQQGDPDSAVADYTAVIEMVDAPAELVAKALNRRAFLHRQQGRPDQAIADSTAVIEMAEAPAEQRAKARINRAVVHGQQGRLDEAIADYTAVIDMRDILPAQRVAALINRGFVYGQLGRRQAAIDDYTAVIAMPDIPAAQRATALNNRGIIYEQLGHPDQALADYRAVIAMPDAPNEQRTRASAAIASCTEDLGHAARGERSGTGGMVHPRRPPVRFRR